MAVVDAPKSVVSDEPNPNPTPNPVDQPEDVREAEEGEIVGSDGDGDVDGSSKSSAAVPQTHPLQHSWTFWFDNPSMKSKQTAWGNSLRSVYTFSTIEEFWGLYNNVRHPSELSQGADFYCFKHKIEPKWEDPICANGGKWTINFPKGKSDTCWLYTLLALIGEQFDLGDEICGAVVNIRGKQERISIWTKNAANEAAQVSIGRQWKEFLDCKDNIGFIIHDDAKVDRNAKNTYTV